MTTMPPIPLPALLAGLALAMAMLVHARGSERRGANAAWRTLGLALVLSPMAIALALPAARTPGTAVLLPALVVALAAREQRERTSSEAALKLLWLLGPAFALSWAGELLLALAAATTVSAEQGAALALGLDPYGLWSVALVLSLLVGWLLLGCVPLHFAVADVAQGVALHLAPLAIASLQWSGALWLTHRLALLQDFPAGLARIESLLAPAALVALLGGAAALTLQRRPERRVGVLASLQGALVLASLASHPTRPPFAALAGDALASWGAHLAVALAGALIAARMSPADTRALETPAVLFRRHPWAGAAALVGTASLAGVPGTPGSLLWLAAARDLARDGHPGLLLALAAAWLVSCAVALSEVRRVFGIAPVLPAPEAAVPVAIRAAALVAALALLATWVRWVWG